MNERFTGLMKYGEAGFSMANQLTNLLDDVNRPQNMVEQIADILDWLPGIGRPQANPRGWMQVKDLLDAAANAGGKPFDYRGTKINPANVASTLRELGFDQEPE
jgi:hypothetical protein